VDRRIGGESDRRLLFRVAKRVGIGTTLLVGGLAVFAVSGWTVPPTLFIAAAALPALGVLVLMEGVDRRFWLAYVLGFVGFAYLRGVADALPIEARFGYVIDLERFLFGGVLPTVWMQERWYRLGSPSALDLYATAIHFSYFVVPHLFALLLWRKRPALARRYIAAALGCYYAGLVVNALLPTAPPWLAGQSGRVPHVFRVMEDVLTGASPAAYDYAYRVAGTNPVAAMPSLHFAIAALVALAAADTGAPGAMGAGAVYAASMGLVLTYGGEHYAVDLLAGGVLAAVAWRFAGVVVPEGRRAKARPVGRRKRERDLV